MVSFNRTIKTIWIEDLKAFNSEFQFHKGTIKTNDPLSLCDNEPNFNSIKVRLKLLLLTLWILNKQISIP